MRPVPLRTGCLVQGLGFRGDLPPQGSGLAVHTEWLVSIRDASRPVGPSSVLEHSIHFFRGEPLTSPIPPINDERTFADVALWTTAAGAAPRVGDPPAPACAPPHATAAAAAAAGDRAAAGRSCWVSSDLQGRQPGGGGSGGGGGAGRGRAECAGQQDASGGPAAGP